MSQTQKTQKIELRVSEATKKTLMSAAAKAGEDLTEFMIMSGKARAAAVAAEVPPLRDGQTPIAGYRYIVREGAKIKFKENGIVAIPTVIGMNARQEEPEDIADALSLPLAAVLEAVHFCATHHKEVDKAVEEEH